MTPGFCLLLAWFAAVNGWGVVLTVLFAAAFHEAGHLLALTLCGAAVRGFRLSAQGAVLDAESSRLSYGREFLCVLAGPAFNLLLAFAAARFRRDALAGASLALCVYNLLPVRPLDGGRAVELAVSWLWGPEAGERTARLCGAAGGLSLACLAGALMVYTGGTLWLLPPLTAFALSAVRELGQAAEEGENGLCPARTLISDPNFLSKRSLHHRKNVV